MRAPVFHLALPAVLGVGALGLTLAVGAACAPERVTCDGCPDVAGRYDVTFEPLPPTPGTEVCTETVRDEQTLELKQNEDQLTGSFGGYALAGTFGDDPQNFNLGGAQGHDGGVLNTVAFRLRHEAADGGMAHGTLVETRTVAGEDTHCALERKVTAQRIP
jgi:hypothetical protein